MPFVVMLQFEAMKSELSASRRPLPPCACLSAVRCSPTLAHCTESKLATSRHRPMAAGRLVLVLASTLAAASLT